jgi:hypothetical protein
LLMVARMLTVARMLMVADGCSGRYGQRMAICLEGRVRVDPRTAPDNRRPCCMEGSVHGF